MSKAHNRSLLHVGFVSLVLSLAFSGCRWWQQSTKAVSLPDKELVAATQIAPNATPLEKVNAGALEQITYTTSYDPAYVKLAYPNGDVPRERGVCADVVVRAFRQGGVDLQKELHEDMTAHFAKYPAKWGAKKPDRNIDHRRVANLMTWLDRRGKSLPLGQQARAYQPGDVVAWELPSGLLHIGLVSKIAVAGTDRYAIVHNIGAGARLEDVLFSWQIIGHYRYF